MRLIFLGTSAGAPTRSRNVTAVALQFVQLGTVWLFDCGEGTQQQVLRSSVKLSHLDRIFISHMHGDHVFGLPGLMASRSAAQNVENPLTIYGPEPLEEYLRTILALTHTRIKYPWTFVPVEEGAIYEDDHSVVDCRRLNHGVPSYGFSVAEKPVPGEFNAALAAKLGVPPGPLYGVLKGGGNVTLPDGAVIEAAGLIGKPRRPRKITICGDTGLTPASIELAADSNILVHEATFMQDLEARAIEVGHSTAAQAALCAKEAAVNLLAITHISPRYDQQDASLLQALLAEAQGIFANSILAEDFLTLEVPQNSAADTD